MKMSVAGPHYSECSSYTNKSMESVYATNRSSHPHCAAEIVYLCSKCGRSRAELQLNHHHQQTNTQFFLQAGCPSSRPTNSVKAMKVKISHSMDLLTPNSPGGLPTLSLTTNSSRMPWGMVAMPLISPLMPVPH